MRRLLASLATVSGTVAAGWTLGALIVALELSNGGESVRNPHNWPPRAHLRRPSEEHGRMDVAVAPDGDRVRMAITFGGRRFWARMSRDDARRIAIQFIEAAEAVDPTPETTDPEP